MSLCEACKPLVETNCNHCVGNIKKREKGIDVMMAVDMLDQCAIKNECEYCILLSGDADFIPAAQIIISHKKKVFSACTYNGYSSELRNTLPFWSLKKEDLIPNCVKE